MHRRKPYYWKTAAREIALGERTLIMGILNVTPDSFSDGGQFLDPDRAFARALEIENEGADILDIGAESTKPGSARISAAEELRRLVPVLKRLKGHLTIPVSVDTYKSEVALKAAEYGAEIFNDPSGLTFDPKLAKAAREAGAALIINHMRGTPETWAKLPPMPDVANSVAQDLLSAVSRARAAGVEKQYLAVDPGLGFGKRKEQNSAILAGLNALAAIDVPILTGASRKSFLAQTAPEDLLVASAAANTAAILHGTHMIRVHDVRAMKVVARIADEIVRQFSESEDARDRESERTARSADGRPPARGGTHVEPPPARRPVVPPRRDHRRP